jgi:hypothetical protein
VAGTPVVRRLFWLATSRNAARNPTCMCVCVCMDVVCGSIISFFVYMSHSSQGPTPNDGWPYNIISYLFFFPSHPSSYLMHAHNNRTPKIRPYFYVLWHQRFLNTSFMTETLTYIITVSFRLSEHLNSLMWLCECVYVYVYRTEWWCRFCFDTIILFRQ